MRSTTLSTLFFALFALLSAVTYAVPVPPQGEIIKRACAMGGCRDAVNTPSSNSDSASDAANAIAQILASFYQIMATPNTATPPAAAYAATATPSAPASQPTGV